MDTLTQPDRSVDTTLNRLAIGLTNSGRRQAALGTQVGGVELRQLRHLPTPAELAAKLTARPNIVELAQALSIAGLAPDEKFTKHLDLKIAQFTQSLADILDPQERQGLPQLVHDIATRAQQ